MILTEFEKDWIKEFGCIHGLDPDNPPIFCPNCKPSVEDLIEEVKKRRGEEWVDVDL